MFHTEPTSSDNIYMEQYKEAIRNNGLLTIHTCQCMPIGLPRVGKTCLYYRLLDEQPPCQPATRDTPGSGSASTDVLADRKMIQVKIDLDKSEAKAKSIVAGEDGWKSVDTLEEEIRIYIKSVCEQQELEKNSSSQSTPSDAINPTTSQNPSMSIDTATDTNDGDNKSSPPQLDLSLIDAIKMGSAIDMTKVEALVKKSLTIFYTDCGGQPEFLEVLPALAAGPTIFMLAFSLCEPLDSLYNVKYESSINEVVKYESSFTVKEVLMKCLSSIHSFHYSQSKSYHQPLQSIASKHAKFTAPPTNVITLATHRDLVSEEEITEIDKKLQECVANTALKADGLIEYYTPERLILPIDNYNKKDGPEVRKVFDRIVKRENKEGESPYKIEIPASWLGLDLYLRQQPSPVVSYDYCLSLCEKLGIKPDSLTSCLWFLHHKIGTIRFYNNVEGLKDTVITEPSIIFKAVTEFITSTFILDNVNAAVEQNFHSYGLFKTEDVENIFNKHREKLQIPLKKFIALLEHLNILGPAHNDDFDHFLPCALTHAPLSKDSDISQEYDPLMVSFPNGFVPLGVYSSLLAYVCVVHHWELMCNQSGKPLLFRDQATFIGHDIPITIKATAKHLEFTANYEMNDGGVCKNFSTIRDDLEKALHQVLDRLKYSDVFFFGFRCSAPDCKESKYHFAEALGEKAKCSNTKKRFNLEEKRKLWFDEFQLGMCMHWNTEICFNWTSFASIMIIVIIIIIINFIINLYNNLIFFVCYYTGSSHQSTGIAPSVQPQVTVPESKTQYIICWFDTW